LPSSGVKWGKVGDWDTRPRSVHRRQASSEQGRQLSFTGEFRHTIDAKGRLIVPSRLRDELTGDTVVLTKYLNGCIAMWSADGWKELEGNLLQLGKSNPNARSVVRMIAASAHPDELDRQGRITIPLYLREWGGVVRDAVVTGALDHGEIWAPEKWEQETAAGDRLDELAAELNF
jgi:MraZ protein